jgi:NCS1 family nucleobase:cation symporter-1
VLTTLLWGAVLLALLAGSMVKLVRRFVSRFGLPLVVLSLLWLTWQFATRLQAKGLDAFWARPGDGSMGMFGALDLVIAMPVSWLPLVADYARHGKRSAGGLGSAFSGTWIGYALANIWCYALGVMVVSVAEPGTGLVTALLLAQGGLVALGLILIDELDNAYGDVYSGSVSTHSLLPRWSVKRWGLLLAALCIALALVLPMHTLEPFLLLLSSVFVPLYGVILGRLGSGGRSVASVGTRQIDWARGADLDRGHRGLPRARQMGAAVRLGPADAGRDLRAGLDQPAKAADSGRRCIGTGAKPWLSGPWPAPTCTSAPAAIAPRM